MKTFILSSTKHYANNITYTLSKSKVKLIMNLMSLFVLAVKIRALPLGLSETAMLMLNFYP